MDEAVTVQFDAGSIVGSGQNISAQGVYFVADASITVTVQIEGVARTLRGELVRVNTMGEGKVGIAVRFLEPIEPAGPGAEG